MSASRWFIAAAVVGSLLLAAEAAYAQGCTAARGCPTLPPPIPARSPIAREPAYNLLNFYATSAGASAETAADARPSGPAGEEVPSNKALIRVTVPADDALVAFHGRASRQQGAVRLFASPALAAGQAYQYVVRCEWNEGERRVAREQRVVVRAGEETTVDFVAAR